MSDDPLRGLSQYWRRRIMDTVRVRLRRDDSFLALVRCGASTKEMADMMRENAAEVRDEFIRDKGLKWPVEEA